MTFKKIIIGICNLILLYWFNFSQAQTTEGVTHSGQQTGQAPFPVNTYNELPNPSPTPIETWKKSTKTTVGWGKTSRRYKKEQPVSEDDVSKTLNLFAWKGEKLSAQWVISAAKKNMKLSVENSGLKHSGSEFKIPKENIQTAFIRYVLTDELNKEGHGSCGHRNPTEFDSTLVADVIDHRPTDLNIDQNTTRPGWVSIQIPENAKGGKYMGVIKILDENKELKKLHISIVVGDRVLPQPKKWNFHLDLWQNPYAAARYYKTDLWSDEHFKAMEQDIRHYANAGGKSITASIIDRPWDGQTQDPFNSMVRWTKKLDGSWNFNFDVFDKWVEFMMDMGVTKQINTYSMIPWKLSFAYFDEATNTIKHLNTQPGEPKYEEAWGAMLKSFASHLKEKNWFEKTYIAMDERPMEAMQETIKVIKKADKNFKISFAGGMHKEILDEIDDYCVALDEEFPEGIVEKRKSQKKISTFYTSCAQSSPNSYTFSAPAETEWYGWHAAYKGLDGYLRWAYNSWVLEPLLDSRFTTWAAGDTYFVYPGGRTSLRMEKLVEGIKAYEKIQILKAEFKKQGDEKSLVELEVILNKFNRSELDNKKASVIIEEANKAINIL